MCWEEAQRRNEAERETRGIWWENSLRSCMDAKELGINPGGSKKTLRNFKYKNNTITVS